MDDINILVHYEFYLRNSSSRIIKKEESVNTRTKHSTKYYYLNASVAEIFWDTVGSALWKFIPSNGRNDPITVFIFGGIGTVTLLVTSPVWAPFVGAYAIGKKISNNQEKSQLEIEWEKEEKAQSIADMAAREKRLKSMPVPQSDTVLVRDVPHEELEFHFDEGRQKWYYESDDLVSEDDIDDQLKDARPNAASVTNQGIFSPAVIPTNQTTVDPRSVEESAKSPKQECKI